MSHLAWSSPAVDVMDAQDVVAQDAFNEVVSLATFPRASLWSTVMGSV